MSSNEYNGPSLISIIGFILMFCFAPAGIALCIAELNTDNGRPKTLAKAGLILVGVEALVGIVLFIACCILLYAI